MSANKAAPTGELLGPAVFDEELLAPLLTPKACAGFPSPADDFLDDPVSLGRLLLPRPASTYLWRVAGDSMIECGIYDGDILVVDRSLNPAHGQVVIALVNGERTVKRLLLNGPPKLACANSALKPFELADTAEVTIWGVVTWNLHRLLPKK